jgi:probable F420-dependent oxidoreductase
MKLAVDFPSVAYREGPEKVLELARALETIGYDELSVFDHVTMGYPIEGRDKAFYPAQMPVIEALMLLANVAAVTERIGLGTEVLVLPQRHPTLVAKQVATLDLLSGGRVRLGVGVGWQASEYESLGEDFHDRGQRMDAAIRALRAWWGAERVDLDEGPYRATAMAMEPKPPQGAKLPIWVGGGATAAIRRAATIGDGWMAAVIGDDEKIAARLDLLRRFAEEAGRDPGEIGLQMMLATPPRDQSGVAFFADHDKVVARAAAIAALGFEWTAINATAVFQAGARSVDAMIEALDTLHTRLRAEVG